MWIDTTSLAVVSRHDQIRAMRPHVSAPALLTDADIEALGFAPVLSATADYNPNTHTATQIAPVRNGAGAWQQAWVITPIPADVMAASLVTAKAAKNKQINEWRAQANQASFTHEGKQIACNALSRSDIDAVASGVSLFGAFPAGFPGAWKAMDNSYVMLPDIEAFKAMYASMTAQGTVNFGKSQALKTQLAAATTIEQVNALTWV